MIPEGAHLDLYVNKVPEYIGGYVARSAAKKIPCHACSNALSVSPSNVPSLVNRKSHGGLKVPSSGVLKVCKMCELAIRCILPTGASSSPQILQKIFTQVQQNLVMDNLFPELASHFMDCCPDDSHLLHLIKCIIQCYSKVRLAHVGKQANAEIHCASLRRKLTKTILFYNQ